MGWVVCHAPCLSCRQVFAFNPRKVPSLGGEPVCEVCMKAANEKRVELGLEPHPIMDGAYAPARESEVF